MARTSISLTSTALLASAASGRAWSERPRYAVTNKTSGRRLKRYLDLGPSLLSIVYSDGITEKHKYSYRELNFQLLDLRTVEVDRGAAGLYLCVRLLYLYAFVTCI